MAAVAKAELGWLVARPIAHRGLHDRAMGRIENSLAAAQAAIAGRYAIECDVQLSADADAIVFHDFELDRLTGAQGLVRERPAAQLASIALSGGGGGLIATLADFLDAVAGAVPVVIEIKSRFDGDLALARRTAEVVAARPGQPIALKSFDPGIVAALATLAPDRPRGIVAMLDYSYPDFASLDAGRKHALANLLHFADSAPDFLSWRVADLPAAAPYLCRQALGLPVMGWTVRTPQDKERAAGHADQIVFEGFTP